MTSLSLNQKKLIRGLARKKVRRETGLFLIEGEKIVKEVLKDAENEGLNCQPRLIAATADWMSENEGSIPGGTDHCTVGADELRQVSSLQQPNKALMIAEQPRYSLEREELREELSIALEAVQDPGNLGTIMRTADWFGIRNIICSAGSADLFNPKVIQASMGSFLRVKVHYTDLIDLFSELSRTDREFNIIASSVDGISLYEFSPPGRGIILLGNESRGISDELMLAADSIVSIPPHRAGHHPESLNISAAAAILCAHMRHHSK